MNQNIQQLIRTTLEGPARENPAIALAIELLRASSGAVPSTARPVQASPPPPTKPAAPISIDLDTLEGLLPAAGLIELRAVQLPALLQLRTWEAVEAVAAPLRTDLETLWPLILHYAPGPLADETLQALAAIAPDEDFANRLRQLQATHQTMPVRIATAVEKQASLEEGRRQSVAGAARTINYAEISRETERLATETPTNSNGEAVDATTMLSEMASLKGLLDGTVATTDAAPALDSLPSEIQQPLKELNLVSASAAGERVELLKQWLERFSAQIPKNLLPSLRQQAEDGSVDVGSFAVKLREALSGKDPQAEAAKAASAALSQAASVLSPATLALHAGHIHTVLGRWWSLPQQEGAHAFGKAIKALEKAAREAAEVPDDPAVVERLQTLATLKSLPQSSTAHKWQQSGADKEAVEELWAAAVGQAHRMALNYLDMLPKTALESGPAEVLRDSLESDDPARILKDLAAAQKKQPVPFLRKPGVRILGAAVFIFALVAGGVAWKQLSGSAGATYTLEFAAPEAYRSLAVYRDGKPVETRDVSGPEMKLKLAPGSYQLFLDDAFSGIEIQSPQPAGASPIRIE